MYNTNNFIPFDHGDLESKNQLIAFARAKDKNKVEEILAATVIYTNLIDYLARHLLENLQQMCSISNYKVFGTVFYYDPSGKKMNISLGNIIRELEQFGFPDKSNFLKELGSFSEIRNRITHDLMKLNLKSNTNQFDQDLEKIGKSAEEILSKYNSIVVGITVIWQQSQK